MSQYKVGVSAFGWSPQQTTALDVLRDGAPVAAALASLTMQGKAGAFEIRYATPTRHAPSNPDPAPGQVWIHNAWAGADESLTVLRVENGAVGFTDGDSAIATSMTAENGWRCLGVATPHGRVMVGDEFVTENGHSFAVAAIVNGDHVVRRFADGSEDRYVRAVYLLDFGSTARTTRHAPARVGERYASRLTPRRVVRVVAVGGRGLRWQDERSSAVGGTVASGRMPVDQWERLDPEQTAPRREPAETPRQREERIVREVLRDPGCAGRMTSAHDGGTVCLRRDGDRFTVNYSESWVGCGSFSSFTTIDAAVAHYLDLVFGAEPVSLSPVVWQDASAWPSSPLDDLRSAASSMTGADLAKRIAERLGGTADGCTVTLPPPGKVGSYGAIGVTPTRHLTTPGGIPAPAPEPTVEQRVAAAILERRCLDTGTPRREGESDADLAVRLDAADRTRAVRGTMSVVVRLGAVATEADDAMRNLAEAFGDMHDNIEARRLLDDATANGRPWLAGIAYARETTPPTLPDAHALIAALGTLEHARDVDAAVETFRTTRRATGPTWMRPALERAARELPGGRPATTATPQPVKRTRWEDPLAWQDAVNFWERGT